MHRCVWPERLLFVKQTVPDRCVKQHPYDSLLLTLTVSCYPSTSGTVRLPVGISTTL